MSLRTRLFTDWHEAASHSQAWRELAAENLFLGPDWLGAGVRAFSPARPRIGMAFSGEKLVGVLPLRLRDRLMLVGLGDDFGDYGGLLLAPGHEAEAAAALLELAFAKTGAARLRLRHLRGDLSSTAWLRAAVSHQLGWPCAWTRKGQTFVIPLNLPYEPLLKQLRSGKSRYNLRRARRQLEARGPLRLRACTTPAAIESALSILLARHAQKWPEGIFSREQGQVFARTMARKGLDTDKLELLELLSEESVVASVLAFRHTGRVYYYAVAYDADFAQYSPGSLLLQAVLERACERGEEELDLLRGPEPYKRDWGAQPVPLITLLAYNPRTLLGRGLALANRLRGRLGAEAECA